MNVPLPTNDPEHYRDDLNRLQGRMEALTATFEAILTPTARNAESALYRGNEDRFAWEVIQLNALLNLIARRVNASKRVIMETIEPFPELEHIIQRQDRGEYD